MPFKTQQTLRYAGVGCQERQQQQQERAEACAMQQETRQHVYVPLTLSLPLFVPWLVVCVHVQRTFREIMFLQDLNNHENIIR